MILPCATKRITVVTFYIKNSNKLLDVSLPLQIFLFPDTLLNTIKTFGISRTWCCQNFLPERLGPLFLYTSDLVWLRFDCISAQNNVLESSMSLSSHHQCPNIAGLRSCASNTNGTKYANFQFYRNLKNNNMERENLNLCKY